MTVESRETGINEVMPGAVLAADVQDSTGNLLLPRGAAVTAAALASLKRRGIASLLIVEETPRSSADEAETRRRIQERIQFLFRASGDSPPARELERQVAAYRLREVE